MSVQLREHFYLYLIIQSTVILFKIISLLYFPDLPVSSYFLYLIYPEHFFSLLKTLPNVWMCKFLFKIYNTFSFFFKMLKFIFIEQFKLCSEPSFFYLEHLKSKVVFISFSFQVNFKEILL